MLQLYLTGLVIGLLLFFSAVFLDFIISWIFFVWLCCFKLGFLCRRINIQRTIILSSSSFLMPHLLHVNPNLLVVQGGDDLWLICFPHVIPLLLLNVYESRPKYMFLQLTELWLFFGIFICRYTIYLSLFILVFEFCLVWKHLCNALM